MESLVAKITVREFFDMELEEGFQYELIDGEIVKKSAPNPQHQFVLGELYFSLKNYLKNKSYGIVFFAPIDVFFDAYNNTQPDLVYVSESKKGIITQNGIEGVPDLIIEILSPSTFRLDRGAKMKLYKYHAVAEYWLVEPTSQTVEVYAYANGDYDLHDAAVETGIISSKLLSDWQVNLQELFKR
ncbi:MAG: Uma2 family endonuclease [Runella sp.]